MDMGAEFYCLTALVIAGFYSVPPAERATLVRLLDAIAHENNA